MSEQAKDGKYFRIRTDAEDFFRHAIDKKRGLQIKWDAYYLCLMAGVKSNSLDRSLKAADTNGFIEYFPEDYKPHQSLIVATVLDHHLREQMKIDYSKKDRINTAMARYTDASEMTWLNAEGIKIFNQYASGGYNVISQDWLKGDKPRDLETWLPTVIDKLG